MQSFLTSCSFLIQTTDFQIALRLNRVPATWYWPYFREQRRVTATIGRWYLVTNLHSKWNLAFTSHFSGGGRRVAGEFWTIKSRRIQQSNLWSSCLHNSRFSNAENVHLSSNANRWNPQWILHCAGARWSVWDWRQFQISSRHLMAVLYLKRTWISSKIFFSFFYIPIPEISSTNSMIFNFHL